MKIKYLLSVALIATTLTSYITAEERSKAPDISAMTGKVVFFSDLVTKKGSEKRALDAVLAYPKVVIDFYADWCGPCKNLSPIIEDLAREFSDILFIKLNVDEYQSISKQYGIRGIPALLFFKDGNKVEQVVGLKSKNDLKRKIRAIY